MFEILIINGILHFKGGGYMILHTHISGEGEPIVLLHSGGMTGLVEFEEQVEFLKEKNYQVIRPDLREKTGKSL